MAWKWYEIDGYKASVGGNSAHGGSYYAAVQLYGDRFYGLLNFHKDGALPDCHAPDARGQRFYGHLDFQQMATVVDLLRNESPVRIGWYEDNPNMFHLMTGREEVGEGDGFIAEDRD